MYVWPEAIKLRRGFDHWNDRMDVEMQRRLSLPIDNIDALVDQISKAMWEEERKHSVGPGLDVLARAALRSIGVPLKKAKK